MKKRWNFSTEVSAEILIDVQVRGYSDPGVRTLANGDPGYPPESDEEREITGIRLEVFVGYDLSNPERPKRKVKTVNLPKELVNDLAPFVQEIVNREEINPSDGDHEPEIEERGECVLHGAYEGSDCPRC